MFAKTSRPSSRELLLCVQ